MAARAGWSCRAGPGRGHSLVTWPVPTPATHPPPQHTGHRAATHQHKSLNVFERVSVSSDNHCMVTMRVVTPLCCHCVGGRVTVLQGSLEGS